MRIFLIFLLTFFVACTNTDKTQNTQDNQPRQLATKVIISQAQNALNDWRLTADKAEFYDGQNQVRLYNPILIESQEGKQNNTLKAKEGLFDINKNLILLQDKVQITSLSQGIKINTSKVYYDTATKEAWSNVPVKIQRGKTTLEAQGFKAEQNFSQIEFFKQKTNLPQNMQDLKTSPLTLQEALDEN